MSYSVKWYQPNKVMCTQFYGVVTPEDLVGHAAQMEAWCADIPHEVHFIANFTNITRPSVNLRDATSAYRKQTGVKVGWVVVILEKSSVIQLVVDLATEILGYRMKVVSTFDEAITFLAAEDPDIQAVS
jgi:hypothetical protein